MFIETKYRRDIQTLRGLAVLAVVLFHAKEGYFPLGYLGVDVFFVISGFVVTPLILRIFTDQGNTMGRLSNLWSFYKRRFYRLAPALAATLAISAITIFLLGPITDHQKFASQGIATLFLAGNVGAYRYSGDYFQPNPNPLVHTWSLSVEEQIYIFLPLVLMVFLHNRRSLKTITAAVLVGISIISFVSFLFPEILQPIYSRAGIQLASQFSFYSPIDRIWQFSIGGLGYLLLNRYHGRNWKISKSMNFTSIIALVIVLFAPIQINLRVSSILASILAVTVIVFKSLDVLPEVLIEKLEWLGDRSYSIYLLHMPLLYIAKYSPVTQIGDSENRLFQSIIAIFAAVLFGALSYSKIENRFRYTAKNNTTSDKTISFALILNLTIPLVFLVSMVLGLKYQYWGLDRTVPRPPAAWNLDSNCNRMSDSREPCLYTIPNSGDTILLIGDSHAGDISQAVVDAAKAANWNAAVWTKKSCHLQFQRSLRNQVTNQCLRQNQMILKWVEEMKPSAVIVSQFVHADSSQSDLRNALLTLQSISPNILLIENKPIFPDEKDFMVARPLVMLPYQPPKSFSLSEMQIKDQNASNQLADWARENTISTMNFDSLFCTKETCTRYGGSNWLYWDDDHFSVAGAALTIPQLVSFLQRF